MPRKFVNEQGQTVVELDTGVQFVADPTTPAVQAIPASTGPSGAPVTIPDPTATPAPVPGTEPSLVAAPAPIPGPAPTGPVPSPLPPPAATTPEDPFGISEPGKSDLEVLTGAKTLEQLQEQQAAEAGRPEGVPTPEQIVLRDGAPAPVEEPAPEPTGLPQLAPPRPGPPVDTRAIRAAAEKEKKGIAAEAEQVRLAAEQIGEIQRQGEEDAAVKRVAQQRSQEARDRKLDELTQQSRDFSDEAASLREDPNKFWADRGNAGRVAGALAIALSEFGRAFIGGRNTALDIINNAIERDLRAQRVQIQQAGARAQAADNLLSRTTNRFDKDVDRENATRLELWKEVARKSAALVEQTKGKVAEPQALQAQAQIDSKVAQIAADLAAKRQQTASGAGVDMQLKILAARRAEAKETREARAFKESRVVPGFGEALTPDDAKEIKEARKIARDLKDAIKTAREVRTEFGREFFGADKAKGEAAGTAIALEIVKQRDLGVIAGADLDLIESLASLDITSSTTLDSTIFAQLDALEKTVEEKLESAIQGRIRPGTRTFESKPTAEAAKDVGATQQ